MVLILNLEKGHCIETAARRKYEQLVNELLKEDNEENEKLLKLLIEFLNKADFKKLRLIGFDGSKEMKVVVKKVDNDFIVEEL